MAVTLATRLPVPGRPLPTNGKRLCLVSLPSLYIRLLNQNAQPELVSPADATAALAEPVTGLHGTGSDAIHSLPFSFCAILHSGASALFSLAYLERCSANVPTLEESQSVTVLLLLLLLLTFEVGSTRVLMLLARVHFRRRVREHWVVIFQVWFNWPIYRLR